jgi:NitT/TauT family transport system permease protein
MNFKLNSVSPKAKYGRILIINDDSHYNEKLEKLFSESFDITRSSHRGAISVLNKRPKPDIILANCDTVAPGKQKSEYGVLFSHLRKHFPEVKLVVLTGESGPGVIEASGQVRAGAYMPKNLDVIIKPVSELELKRILFQMLGARTDGSTTQFRRLFSTFLPPTLIFIAFIILWELFNHVFGIKEYLLPTPTKIASVLVSSWSTLLKDSIVTMSEALAGFFIANILSVFVAVGFSHSQWLERSFYPYVVALKSIPIVALAPILVIWFGYGFSGKVVMASVMAFFPLVVNATIGLKNVDPHAIELLHTLSASRWQILWKLRFPTAVPYILSALKISSALAVMGAIVAEMTGASTGLGYTIMVASYNIDTPLLFAAVVVAAICGISFFGIIALLEGYAAKIFMFDPKNQTA